MADAPSGGDAPFPINHIEPRNDDTLNGVPLVDLRGLNCPLPALKAGRRMRELPPGGQLWFETTDPLATIDIPSMARENGHELVESRAVNGGHRFLLERGGDTPNDHDSD